MNFRTTYHFVLSISFLLFSIQSIFSQDTNVPGNLILTGSNGWIFHTPETRGRTDLYMAPLKSDGSGSDWAKQTIFKSNGNTVFNGGISINGVNETPSVNGFRNRISLGGIHAAIVFNSGSTKELMFGFHDDGNFYWGTGRSATKPDYYSMSLNGNTGDLNVRGKVVNSGPDFILGTGDNREQGSKKSNRALVHVGNDELHVNYNGDFEGGTVIGPGGFLLQSDQLLDGTWRQTHFNWQGHSLIFGTKPNTYAHNVIELKPGGSDRGSLLSAFKMHHANSKTSHDLRVNIDSRTNHPTYFDVGNVGIGTRDPKNKLSVNGTIWAKEVKVSLTDAADWVFEADYKLQPLAEVEAFIKRNKHLPEMPSADEFRANDMKVSEMSNKLLQKVEELTLYTIAQEKQLDNQASINQQLQAANKALKQRLEKLEALLLK